MTSRRIYRRSLARCRSNAKFFSLDIPVRAFPLDAFLAAMDRLFARGVRHFKFVDRTFNLHLETGRRILSSFWPGCSPGCSCISR